MGNLADDSRSHTDPRKASDRPSAAAQIAAEPRWKKLLLIASAVFVIVGVVLMFVESGSDGGTATGAGGAGGGATPPGGASFTGSEIVLPGGEGERIGKSAADEENWSPVFLRLGFSFFVGYALGFAARSVLKLTLLFVGLFAAGLFGLQEFGFVDVRWDAMGDSFDGFMAKIGDEASSLRGLFTGRLPSAGLAGLGLFAGFKRG